MPRKSVAQLEDDLDRLLRKSRSLIAEGIWRRMRYLIETKSDRAPYARCDGLPLTTPEKLADAIRCPGVKVTRALTVMLESGLVRESAEGYYPPILQRIIEVRASDRRRQKLFRDSHLKRRKSKNKGLTINQGVMSHPEGVMSHGCHTLVTPDPHPPPSLSPTTPIPIPPPDPQFPNAAHSGGDDVLLKKSGGKPAKAKPEAKFGEGVWKRACDGWMRAYRHIHGTDYIPPSDRAWKSLADILRALGGDLAELEKVVKAWLREPEVGMNKGHELHALFQNLNYIRGKIAKGTVGHDNAKSDRRAVAAGREYATDLPVEVRRFGNEPDDA
jgi:hypothetical protein